jgi:hypothetical protein
MRRDPRLVLQNEQRIQHVEQVVALHVAEVTAGRGLTACNIADNRERILFVDYVVAVGVADRISNDIAASRADSGAGRY